MTRINDRLPAALSERLATASQSIFSTQGREVDVAIGGIPFRLATSQDFPRTVETIPIRKDQVDTESDPGEQSLTGWWRRSQSSWGDGAGSLYQESNDTSAANLTFYDSRGIDVFTPGQFTLIREMVVVTGSNPANLTEIRSYLETPTLQRASAVGNGILYKGPLDDAFVALHAPASKTVNHGFINGTTFYDVAYDGTNAYTLYKGDVSAPGSATSWPLGPGAGSTVNVLGWGMHRLWACGGTRIWQPDLSLSGGTTQSPVYTHPNTAWNYTAMAEGSSAVYFAGNDGQSSTIQAITLDAAGALPTLTGATVVATMPDGEIIQKLAVLAGSFIGIGTNKGFRVGTISNGKIAYGPLLFTPGGFLVCTALTTHERFFVVAFNSNEGPVAYRIDTGNPLNDGVFPYAKDIECGTTGYIDSLSAYGLSLLATTSLGVPYWQATNTYVSTGYLQTGRIRYHITEPKLFKYLSMEIAPLKGNIQIDLIDDAGTTVAIGNITTQNEVFLDKFAINASRTLRYASLKFTLTRDGSTLNAPVVNSYLVRSLPAVAPQRLITLPLLCLDYETSMSGQRYGGLGYAADRLAALQALEALGDTVVYQNFALSGGAGQITMLESVKYVETSPPPANRSGNGGGILIVQLRTADA